MARLVRWLPVGLVLVLLGAAMLAAASSEIVFERAPVTPPSPPPSPPPGEDAPDPIVSAIPGDSAPPPGLPAWIGMLIAGLCLAAVIALVGALVWILLRDRLSVRRAVPTPADPEEIRRRMREQVRAAVDEGLTDLDVDDGDPRRAVIACWARLEAAAAAAGTQRQPGDTSTELVARLLAEHAITAPVRDKGAPQPGTSEERTGRALTGSVLDDFAAVYRAARFATHVVDEAMREQARAALRQVRDELVAGAGAR